MHRRGMFLGSAALMAGAAVFYAADVKLPPPFATPSVNNGPRVIPKPESAKLNVPAGFQAEVWAEGFSGGHWTRTLLFDRAGKKLYVTVGSGSNVSTGEDPRRAAVNRYNPDG